MNNPSLQTVFTLAEFAIRLFIIGFVGSAVVATVDKTPTDGIGLASLASLLLIFGLFVWESRGLAAHLVDIVRMPRSKK